MEKIKVLLVDDHTLFRRGVAAVLAGQENIEVLGEAPNGLEAVKMVKDLKPDAVLMDLMMPECGGLEATAAIQTEVPGTNVLILTVSDKEADLFGAIKSGAKGYILKSSEPEELIQAIIHIAKGGVIVSPAMAAKLLTEFKPGVEERPSHEGGARLSKREEEVLQQVAKGATNKEIAGALFISENTVKTHLRAIMDELHLVNRSQAAAYATRIGLHIPRQD
ncbi:MAG: response regulator transcription factor [Dehalococcoidia bacterium]|nr:response regulator transcription factor [Dehalococcoidia bacterium]